ncbi:50S ribosomal subunit protein L3 [Wigglesworthia glossinidia endosymbiont of Glossina morsitans morsitans (Yale colony)]|uniref:Large ribosomal subunit protein uL3 n=1 Tax=Wigglesworthia glossinidia endosymbiont of Glossina morsitans morsitans (Yale colony) TaxID=1142511 RepID=H6Q4J3_WIGGL|nr:50S ribosomal protein L3 [Wigglesworthia glossinidia]AFA41053.1 50S ribosomal subunit protein L3 [Wigglesworthia glossinidia endosymbiont of Glossina morsitans morsitans (Yale colony)]
MYGLVGRKIGMTQIFNAQGQIIPVTVIQIHENRIVQIKNMQNDKYSAIQITTGIKNSKNINKSIIGHFKKANISLGRGLWEFRINKNHDLHVGQKFSIENLNKTKKVDITGISKGKGFSGTMKRWNFSGQDASHGNSLSHRAPGSIGQNQTPGKVFKGKKMSGQLGCNKITIQNIVIIKIDVKNELLLVRGSVPGFNKSDLIIKPAVKYFSNDHDIKL